MDNKLIDDLTALDLQAYIKWLADIQAYPTDTNLRRWREKNGVWSTK